MQPESPRTDQEVQLTELDGSERADGASFSGSTGRRSAFLRIGAIAGAAAALVLGAALTMAASPSPSASSGANGAPSASNAPGSGGPWTARGMMGGRGWLKGGGIGPFGAITITGIDGSQLSLRTTDGWTRTITVGSSTTITRGGQAIAIGDLKVGDEIRVRETRDSGGTFTITAIDVVLPHVEGTVGALTSDGFTVKAPDGSTTKVVVTSSTTYRTGRASGSRSDVKVGDRVAVRGTKATDGTITATTVQVAPAMAAGTVTAKTSTTITISLPGGTSTTIHVSSATTYKVAGKASATLADVAIGDRLVAQGTLEADGSLDATAVGSGPARGPGKGWGMGPGGPMGGFGPTSPGAPMGGFGPMGGMGGFGSGGDPGQQG